MIVTDAPDVQYTYRRSINAADALAFIAEIETLEPGATVGYFSGNLQATRGVWVRIGRYRIASDSFIDPSDLMLYVASYYEPDDAGAVEAIELNHGDSPDGALHAETLDELLDALAQLDFCEDAKAANGADENPIVEEFDSTDTEQEAGDASGREEDLPAMPSRLEGIIALEPAAAHEMHGLLVKGWHAMYYEALDGSSLLVFDQERLIILRGLLEGVRRFGELKRSVTGISQKTLTPSLRERAKR